MHRPHATALHVMSDEDSKTIDLNHLKTVAARITEAVQAVGGPSKAAKVTGVSTAPIHRWQNADLTEAIRALIALADESGLPISYLVGRGPKTPPPAQNELPGLAPGFVGVRMLDVALSAGSGRLQELESDLKEIAFREDWLVRRLAKVPDQVKALSVSGDSMQPLIRDGDLVLVDLNDRTPRTGGIFAIRMPAGELVVKELRFGEGPSMEAWEWTSAKEGGERLYHRFRMGEPETERAVIGRVFWRGGKI